MGELDKALETQVKNLQTRSGKSLEELFSVIRKSGLAKHGEIRDMLKLKLKMGHGDANTLVHLYRSQESNGMITKAIPRRGELDASGRALPLPSCLVCSQVTSERPSLLVCIPFSKPCYDT